MSQPLPVVQTDPTSYERPTQTWVCGSTDPTGPCRLGPDARVRCRAAGECQPVRKGQGWACSRPAAAGGPCADGPSAEGACSHLAPPCRPVRSLRSWRGRVALCAAALSAAVVAGMVWGPWRHDIVSPGDLTFKHGTVAQSCDACHTADSDRPQTWLQAAVSAHGGIPEGRKCLECHQLGDHALAAHGLSAAALDDVHRRVAADPPATRTALTLQVARGWPGQPLTHGDELACATCHHEHRGKDAKITAMDDQQCQACHAKQFPSFGEGHPEFNGYPYHQRTAVYFDHVSHLGRHFNDFARTMPYGKKPDSCLTCHEQSPAGRMMLVRGFEQACASCHQSQIEDSSLGGVAFLNLPGVDVQTLRKRPGLSVGEWPESAGGDLAPFMRLLLSTDERFVKAEAVLKGKVDLRDLRTADDAQCRAAEQYVWAIKNLVYDVTHEGATALRGRLEAALGEGLDGPRYSSLSGDLPPELVRDAQQRWLPALDAEVQAHRANLTAAPQPAPKPPGSEPPAGGPRRRWFRNDDDFSLRYRPKGHAGDFMHAWLERSAEAPAADGASPLHEVFTTLSDPYGPGRCTKCHAVENVGGRRRVDWLSRREAPEEHAFTKFAHVPHFSLLGEEGCGKCHVLNENADVARGFVHPDCSLNTDPSAFESSFAPMSKAGCATCHVQKAAGDSCLTCHNYHIGSLPPALPKAPIPPTGGP